MEGVADAAQFQRPGWFGRGLRLVLGLLTLWLLVGLLLAWRAPLWAGEVPLELGFVIAVVYALYTWSRVVQLLVNRPWGQRPLVLTLAVAGLIGLVGQLAGFGVLNPALGAFVWVWFVAFTGLLGVGFVLAAALGTPGCEMRSYAHLASRLRGVPYADAPCPGGIDRWDHVGR